MIKNNFFIPILTIALLTSGLGISTAYANTVPAGCDESQFEAGLAILPTSGEDFVLDGETVEIVVNISNFDDNGTDDHCNVTGALTELFTPDATGAHTEGLPGTITGTGEVDLCIPGGSPENPTDCNWDANNAGLAQDATIACYVSDDNNTDLTDRCNMNAQIFEVSGLTVTINVNDGVTRADFRVLSYNDDGLERGAGNDEANAAQDLNVPVRWNYDIDTLSDPQGAITDENDLPVTSVTDTITILGEQNVEGTFDVTKADLYNDDTSTKVGSIGDGVTCDSALTTDDFTSGNTIDCTWTGSALDPGTYCWDVTVDETTGEDGFYSPVTVYHNGCDNSGPDTQDNPRLDDGDEQFTVPPDYDIDTISDPQGLVEFGNGEVTTASDTITILGEDGHQGTFDVTKADLYNDDTSTKVGSIGDGVTCDSAMMYSTFDENSVLVCTWTGSALDPGTYCWDVTVDDTSDTYLPTEVVHNGCANSGPDTEDNPRLDDDDEQFTIPNPYDIDTLSDPQGAITDENDLPVTSVTDTITILGEQGQEGTFDVTKADLYNDDTSTKVGSIGDGVTCDSALTTDDFTSGNTIDCTWTGSALDPGTYCWDVTVDDTSDNYQPTEAVHNGCANSGPDTEDNPRLDDDDEQFTVPPSFDFTTLSDPQGDVEQIDLPLTSVKDVINIIGVDGEAGEFQGTGTLRDASDGSAVAGTVTCLPDTHDIDTFPDNTMECTWEDGGNELPIGTYCWDITVVDTSDNYLPVSVTHNACPQDENDTLEQFTIPGGEGHTPGFYKNNWDKFCDSETAGPPYNDCSWYLERGTDDFSEKFDLGEELILKANGKNTYDNANLREALDANGGGVNALARHCVAAKLNAEHPEISYPIPDFLGPGGVQEQCKAALLSGNPSEINELKNQLDEYNNLGTDPGISQHWPN